MRFERSVAWRDIMAAGLSPKKKMAIPRGFQSLAGSSRAQTRRPWPCWGWRNNLLIVTASGKVIRIREASPGLRPATHRVRLIHLENGEVARGRPGADVQAPSLDRVRCLLTDASSGSDLPDFPTPGPFDIARVLIYAL
jgi:hypothetical protein